MLFVVGVNIMSKKRLQLNDDDLTYYDGVEDEEDDYFNDHDHYGAYHSQASYDASQDA